jgi:hypothetical protein
MFPIHERDKNAKLDEEAGSVVALARRAREPLLDGTDRHRRGTPSPRVTDSHRRGTRSPRVADSPVEGLDRHALPTATVEELDRLA